jgi:hypothetical protein
MVYLPEVMQRQFGPPPKRTRATNFYDALVTCFVRKERKLAATVRLTS